MLKRIGLILVITWIVLCMIGIWLIGGQIAAYLWNFSVFIMAPCGLILCVCSIILFVRSWRGKKQIRWNVIYFICFFILALPITVLFGISPVTYPRKEKPEDGVSLLVPVREAVLYGGEDYRTHAMWPSECYAYDILRNPYEVGSNKLSDYGIYGADIQAPISGTVIGVEEDEPDIEPGSDQYSTSLGNYIFIKIDETDTYLILAHLQQNSILVTVGSHIEEGTIIGKVGNSGTTSEPHLHIQHQRNNPLNMRIPICAEGLPIQFY